MVWDLKTLFSGKKDLKYVPKSLAPVVLFTYNRLSHTQKTIQSLQKNKWAEQTELYIYSDGAKSDKAISSVEEVRAYLKTVQGFKNVRLIEREKNLGLAENIIQGVTDIINKHGKVIVLEDDMLTSPLFLEYMNHSLDLYENDNQVISVHGYTYPVSGSLPHTFFIKGADCWGWATWQRGWNFFERDGRKLQALLKEKNLENRLNYFGAYPFTQMLQDQIDGKNNSWAIRWAASALVNDKLTLYPGKSLVENFGFDSSGTHCGETEVYDVKLDKNFKTHEKIKIYEDTKALKKFEQYFRKAQQGG